MQHVNHSKILDKYNAERFFQKFSVITEKCIKILS